MKFLEHDDFANEAKAIQKKQSGLAQGLTAIQKLLDKQFDPITPIPSIGPGKIHRITATQTWVIWKV